MKKSVLIVGLGRYGRYVAKKMNELDHEILAVDKDEEKVNLALPFVTNALVADTTDPRFLESLGVRNFDLCIVAIGDDFQSSLETTLRLKELGAQYVVSRASRGIHEKFLLRNGADEVVYPEKQLANWTAIRCTSEHILDYIDLDGDYSIFELAIPEIWDGKTILQIDIRRKYGINILGVREKGKLNMNITPDTVLHSGLSILVLGHQKAVQKCFRI